MDVAKDILRFCQEMGKGIFGRMKRKMPPLDPTKVQNKVNELNQVGKPGAPHWVAADGMKALTTMTNENGVVNFNPNSGIPVKAFVNTESGEMKIFDARSFT